MSETMSSTTGDWRPGLQRAARPRRREVLPARRREVLGEGRHLRALPRRPGRACRSPSPTRSTPTSGRSGAWAPTRVRVYHAPPRDVPRHRPRPTASRCWWTCRGRSTAASSTAAPIARAAAGPCARPRERAAGTPALLRPERGQRDPARRGALVRAAERVERFIDELVDIGEPGGPRARSSPSRASRPPSTCTRERWTSTP